ncbi:MAG: ATP-binding cassette domain-containing protein [Longimicrobiales bacterium]
MSVLQARAISRAYGPVQALEQVSLTLDAGTITCLMGDNGAGKSTLVRILSGASQPTSGTLLLDEQTVFFDRPATARGHGVITVYQDLALAPLMSVWRNFVLGAEPVHGRWIRSLDVRGARVRARAELERFQLSIDVDRPVRELSGGERQVLAIARAINLGARVLILDEPTAALAVTQVERVLAAITEARSRGTAILLVTHNPQHALACADRIIVLQLGRVVAAPDPHAIDATQLTRAIVAPS